MSKQFFILGAMKSGTTSLYQSLRQHPEICMSRGKEPTFFELDREYNRGKQYYLKKYYKHYDGETFRGDGRPRNLFLPWVPERIITTFPEAKFVVILRDPVQRAFSFYRAARRSGIPGTEEQEFGQAIFENHRRLQNQSDNSTEAFRKQYQEEYEPRGDGKFKTYLEEGYYLQLIERYIRRSSRDRVKVVLFEDFIESALDVSNEVFEFLELSKLDEIKTSHEMGSYQPRSYWFQKLLVHLKYFASFIKMYKFFPQSFLNLMQSLNVGARETPEMKPLVRDWLYKHYQEPNRRLGDFLNRSLEEWKSAPDIDEWIPINSKMRHSASSPEGGEGDNIVL